MSDNRKKAASNIWTLSNIITLIRICLVPVFVVALLSPWPEWFGIAHLVDDQTKSLVAAAVFILISATDWIDGYLARKRNEVTDFGKFMDPLADKILVAAALLALVELSVLPAWPVLIILAREFIVSGVRMIAASKNEVIAASWYGKAKTVAQIIAIVLFLIKDALIIPNAENINNPLYVISWVTMIVALILTIISMLDYISKARHLLGFKPAKLDAANSDECDIDDEFLNTLAADVVCAASNKGVTISSAESLTGGMVSCALTSVAGSSSVVMGGVASYALSVKSDVLGVDLDTLKSDGAVNARTAIDMAKGAQRILKSDFAVSTTGIAGPTGAEPGKPIGTVWFAVSTPYKTEAEVMHFEGNRDKIRRLSAKKALDILLEAINRDAR
ncbi:CDP-diacylglycerol--glycerol-3-phosphate 3-phosphatidyltransferase [Adlercreutzia sp. ZJ154]|uniref:CDP-diacylglycerol--glycerol-3-phosphate 3-phosphatidyltransferase n=1 Tax=Adlercreutzia sp. ZJ154 TaxID=2709790 RepID=UPI0013EA0487|nr:CDP-diacylglycerol--glycerol-3-phosphate 3-phosphatidyltransferase [Adlercreutzia sp. ZJ154]